MIPKVILKMTPKKNNYNDKEKSANNNSGHGKLIGCSCFNCKAYNGENVECIIHWKRLQRSLGDEIEKI